MPTLFAHLEIDWADLAARPASASRLSAWSAEHDVLVGYSGLGQVVAFAHQRHHPDATDRVLHALVTLAATDPLAARTLLACVTPGLKAIARDHRHHGSDDLVSEIVSVAWERIRLYPLARRPHHIAANIVLDTRQALHRHHRRARVPTQTLDTVADLTRDEVQHPAVELLRLVDSAVRERRLNPAQAALIVATRIADTPIAEVAAATGRSANVIRQYRSRAEHRLAAASA